MMKEVILSHDSEAKIYLVPDEVSDNLDTYCWNFAANWLWQSPHAKKYHKIVNGIDYVTFGAPDFIDYLNKWIFPNQLSTLVKGLGCYDYEIPEEYKDYPQYNF